VVFVDCHALEFGFGGLGLWMEEVVIAGRGWGCLMRGSVLDRPRFRMCVDLSPTLLSQCLRDLYDDLLPLICSIALFLKQSHLRISVFSAKSIFQ
jgi:hypothetical protein